MTSCAARLSLSLALLLGVTACRTTQESPPPPTVAEESVQPGINREFLSPDLDPEEWVERFEREGREIYDRRHEIVDALRLRRGMTVADIGAGSGLFSALFASRVGPEGKVYAVDIAAPFVDLIRERAAEAGLRQIVGVVCTERSVELPASSIDLAFVCDTYHHFEYPRASLASIHSALRRDGELIVIDFHRIPGKSSDWILNHVRAGQDVFTQEIEASGFVKVEEIPLLQENYMLRFRKAGR